MEHDPQSRNLLGSQVMLPNQAKQPGQDDLDRAGGRPEPKRDLFQFPVVAEISVAGQGAANRVDQQVADTLAHPLRHVFVA